MKWDTSEERRPELVGIQGLTEYVDRLQPSLGVYIFVNLSDEVKYVGRAGAGRMVIEIKDAVKRGKNKDDGWIKALYTNSEEAAVKLETELIRKYDPPNNKT